MMSQQTFSDNTQGKEKKKKGKVSGVWSYIVQTSSSPYYRSLYKFSQFVTI